MEIPVVENLEGLQKDAFYILVCFAIIGVAAGIQNFTTPDEPLKVGYVEVHTECVGAEVNDYCLGVQRQRHETFNYDNYTKPEPGTPNFYRRVESELMAQAYDICNAEMDGMEWTDQAEYRNQTGTEWLKKDEVDLLPCEKTFYRDIDAEK